MQRSNLMKHSKMSSNIFESPRRCSQQFAEEVALDGIVRGERHGRKSEVSKKGVQVNNNAGASRKSTTSGKKEKLQRDWLKSNSDTFKEMSIMRDEMDRLKKKENSYDDKFLNISTNAACRTADDLSYNQGSSIDYSYAGKSSGSSVYYNDTASIKKMSRIKAERDRLNKKQTSYGHGNVSTNAASHPHHHGVSGSGGTNKGSQESSSEFEDYSPPDDDDDDNVFDETTESERYANNLDASGILAGYQADYQLDESYPSPGGERGGNYFMFNESRQSIDDVDDFQFSDTFSSPVGVRGENDFPYNVYPRRQIIDSMEVGTSEFSDSIDDVVIPIATSTPEGSFYDSAPESDVLNTAFTE